MIVAETLLSTTVRIGDAGLIWFLFLSVRAAPHGDACVVNHNWCTDFVVGWPRCKL